MVKLSSILANAIQSLSALKAEVDQLDNQRVNLQEPKRGVAPQQQQTTSQAVSNKVVNPDRRELPVGPPKVVPVQEAIAPIEEVEVAAPQHVKPTVEQTLAEIEKTAPKRILKKGGKRG